MLSWQFARWLLSCCLLVLSALNIYKYGCGYCRGGAFKCCSKVMFNIKQVQLYEAFCASVFLPSLCPFSFGEKSWGEHFLLGKFHCIRMESKICPLYAAFSYPSLGRLIVSSFVTSCCCSFGQFIVKRRSSDILLYSLLCGEALDFAYSEGPTSSVVWVHSAPDLSCFAFTIWKWKNGQTSVHQ